MVRAGIHILLTLVLFAGCKTKIQPSTSHAVTKQDSASTQVTKNTTSETGSILVEKPATKLQAAIPAPCDSNKSINQTLQAGNNKLKIKTVHDTLYVDCDCEGSVKELTWRIHNQDSTFSSYKQRVNDSLAITTQIINSKSGEGTIWKVRFYFLLLVVILALALYIRHLIIKKIKHEFTR